MNEEEYLQSPEPQKPIAGRAFKWGFFGSLGVMVGLVVWSILGLLFWAFVIAGIGGAS